MKSRRAIAVVFALLVARTVSAERVLPEPTVEDAAVAARCVVDAELVETWHEATKEASNVELWSVRVRHVLAGPPENASATTRPATIHADDVVSIAGIEPRYQVSPDLAHADRPRSLAAGDRVILFLSAKGDRYNGYVAFGETSADWIVPDNAVWYVAGGNVYAFAQFWGERWWAPKQAFAGSVTITKTPAAYPRLTLETLADLQDRVFKARAEKR